MKAYLKVECERKTKDSEQQAQKAEAELEAMVRQLEREEAHRADEAQAKLASLTQELQSQMPTAQVPNVLEGSYRSAGPRVLVDQHVNKLCCGVTSMP